MSEHKWQEAYKKGFEDGKRNAFSLYCHECYDELSKYEQVKLMVKWGADIPNILDKIMAEIMAIGNWSTKSELPNGDLVKVLKIIDKYKAESEDKDADSD